MSTNAYSDAQLCRYRGCPYTPHYHTSLAIYTGIASASAAGTAGKCWAPKNPSCEPARAYGASRWRRGSHCRVTSILLQSLEYKYLICVLGSIVLVHGIQGHPRNTWTYTTGATSDPKAAIKKWNIFHQVAAKFKENKKHSDNRSLRARASTPTEGVRR